MRPTSACPRPGRLLLSLGICLFLLFLGLVVLIRIHIASSRYLGNEDLVAELSESEILDDPPLQSREWPQWRGMRRDGVTGMPDLLRTWPEDGPPQVWRHRGGDAYSSFAVAAGRACTMIAGDTQEAIVCFDLETGNEHWRRRYKPRRTFDYGGPRATPTIVGDHVYAASPAGTLMCLNFHTGDFVWHRDLIQDLGATAPRWGFACSPLVEGDLVFVIAGGSKGRCLAAFDKTTGELVWARENDPPGYSSPIAATIDGVRQVLFFTGSRVLGVSPADGKVLWDFPWLTRFEVNAATPVVFRARRERQENTYVFISSGYDRGCALVKVHRDPKGESFRARRVYESDALCCHFSSPVRYKDHLYGLDETRDLTCLDLRTGEVAWRFEREEDGDDLRSIGFRKGALIRVEDLLVVLGENGKLALVEASANAYREVAASRPFRDRCWALPALAEGRLLVRDRRQILCLDVRKGSPKD